MITQEIVFSTGRLLSEGTFPFILREEVSTIHGQKGKPAHHDIVFDFQRNV